jgi:hypothetical protein
MMAPRRLKPPRHLVDRDPHNPMHIGAALRLIETLAEKIYATKRTVAELRQLGIDLKTAEPPNGPVDAIIGAFFFLDRGLLFADNLLVTCAVCRAPLQVRPHSVSVSARMLCCFCAVDASLADYWDGKSPPKGQ